MKEKKIVWAVLFLMMFVFSSTGNVQAHCGGCGVGGEHLEQSTKDGSGHGEGHAEEVYDIDEAAETAEETVDELL